MTPEYTKKRDELFSSALHQISTRALRDAPVYLEHVSSAKHGIEQGVDRLVKEEVARLLAADTRTLTVDELSSQIRMAEFELHRRRLIEAEVNARAEASGLICLEQDDYRECM